MLSVVALVVLSDTVPSAGLTLNVTASPTTGGDSKMGPVNFSTAPKPIVNSSPGLPDKLSENVNMIGADGGGLTVAVPLVDMLPTVAVIVYEPEALFPSITVVEARPSLPVVVLVVPSDALPSPDIMLNVTVFPDAALPSS